jgi:hypothetical protein
LNCFSKIALLFILGINLHSQSIHLKYSSSFGEFKEASSFSVDQYKNIYIADAGSNMIYKYSSAYEQTASAGGYGWDENTLDLPLDLAISFDLFLYICDYNNHRLQKYDKNLNYISSIFSKTNPARKENFGYPKSIALSSEGGIFFIDLENTRIVQLDVFRNFLRDFGGINSGEGKLKDPSKIRIDPQNNIYVIDNDKIVSFDIFGNFIKTINNDSAIIGIAFYQNNIALLEREQIKFIDTNTKETSIIPLTGIISDSSNGNNIRLAKDICIIGNQLYLLFNHKLFILEITI